MAVIVLARLQINYTHVGETRLLRVQNQSGLRWTESNADLLVKLACLRHCNTSQTAGPFKQGRVCVDRLTGVVKSSAICDCWNNGCVTIMMFSCTAWWSWNAWRETVQIHYKFYCTCILVNDLLQFWKMLLLILSTVLFCSHTMSHESSFSSFPSNNTGMSYNWVQQFGELESTVYSPLSRIMVGEGMQG